MDNNLADMPIELLALKNIEKYEIYKVMKLKLTKALKSGFYYEAIFIEYAIIEDRCSSLLKHAVVMFIDKKGFEQKLSSKLNKLRGHRRFSEPFVRKRISLELIDEIEAWKRERDRLIHALAKIKYNDEEVKAIAERGSRLSKTLENKVKSVNHYYAKGIDEKQLNHKEI